MCTDTSSELVTAWVTATSNQRKGKQQVGILLLSFIENRLDNRGYYSKTTFWRGESQRTEWAKCRNQGAQLCVLNGVFSFVFFSGFTQTLQICFRQLFHDCFLISHDPLSLQIKHMRHFVEKGGGKMQTLFVNKQLFWWSASITLDNNNTVLADFKPIFSLYTLPHTSVGLTGCISIVFSVLNILTHLTTMLPVGSL